VRKPALGCAAVLTLVAGCGTSTAGEAIPGGQSTVESTTTSRAPDYSLARLCELLGPEEARGMGGSAEGEKGNSINDGHELCTWADEMTLIVGVQPGRKSHGGNKGPAITNTPVTVDGLPATLSHQTKPVVLCQVLIDLPGGNLFSAGAGPQSKGEGKYDSCVLAKQMAELIVPRVKDQ
jgi:uncharacterized protein DUF3558